MNLRVLCGLIAFSGVLAGCAPKQAVIAGAPAAPGIRDTHEQLQGTLWMQTAAEYWALTSSTYRAATANLQRALDDPAWTAATEQTGEYRDLPGAVILDLDETVLDNSPFQAQQVIDRAPYSAAKWTAWVEKMSAEIIPGAKEFLTFAESRGVKVFFVSNRTLEEQEETLKNLAAKGIKASDETVLSNGENGWTSDKTSRRAFVAKSHRVLLLVGDDMNDFISTAKLTPQERVALAQKHADKWGSRWMLLPNPMYGSWDRAVYPGLTDDAEILRRKRESLRLP